MKKTKITNELKRQLEICKNTEKYNNIIDKILKLDTKEKIINLISKSKVNIIDFKCYIDSYLIKIKDKENKDNYNKIKDKLENSYNEYVNNCCKTEEIKNKLNNPNNVHIHKSCNTTEIKNLIINGIEEDGKIRDFELLDYFETTTLELKDFFDLVEKDLTISELKKIKSFVIKNMNIIKANQFTDVNKYKLSFLINNEVVEVTEEAKEAAISYLKENNIPVINMTYKQAVKRYMYKKTVNKN